MCRSLLDVLLALILASFLAGCACLHPASCAKRKHPVCDKLCLIQNSFSTHTADIGGQTWTIYVCGRGAGKKDPPVLLLHEMPALSAEVLELGVRLRDAGYTVYVPLLFGKPEDNPQSQLLGVARGIAMWANSNWRASRGDVRRPIIDKIATLCREEILPHHPRQRLGVIGMCFTGVFPIALLRENDLRIAAPVVSQPAIPLPSCTEAAQKQTGISPAEMQLILRNVAHDNIEILGFRFALDRVSPERRFETLKQVLNVNGRHFIDCTIPKDEYVKQGHLSDRAHSVLTGCFHKDLPPDGSNPSSTEVAWQRLLVFLHAKLREPESNAYIEPYPDRRLK